MRCRVWVGSFRQLFKPRRLDSSTLAISFFYVNCKENRTALHNVFCEAQQSQHSTLLALVWPELEAQPNQWAGEFSVECSHQLLSLPLSPQSATYRCSQWALLSHRADYPFSVLASLCNLVFLSELLKIPPEDLKTWHNYQP